MKTAQDMIDTTTGDMQKAWQHADKLIKKQSYRTVLVMIDGVMLPKEMNVYGDYATAEGKVREIILRSIGQQIAADDAKQAIVSPVTGSTRQAIKEYKRTNDEKATCAGCGDSLVCLCCDDIGDILSRLASRMRSEAK